MTLRRILPTECLNNETYLILADGHWVVGEFYCPGEYGEEARWFSDERVWSPAHVQAVYELPDDFGESTTI